MNIWADDNCSPAFDDDAMSTLPDQVRRFLDKELHDLQGVRSMPVAFERRDRVRIREHRSRPMVANKL